METKKKKASIVAFGIVAFALLLFLVAINLIVSDGFSIWYFDYVDMDYEQDVGVGADTLSYNLEKDVSGEVQSAKVYDVYFLAQNLDINNFIERDDRVNDINHYRFKNEGDSHGLFYTNPDYNITAYEPRLGSWDSNFSTDSTIASNLYKKFENVTNLTSLQIDSVGEPYSKMCDGISKSGAVWDLKFLVWTLDVLKLDYDISYELDSQYHLPVIDPETNQPKVRHSAIEDASIYLREYWQNKNIEGYFQVYGTYPTKGFEIAHLDALLESYDNYAKTINGKKCLFFYPIYSLGKDYSLGNIRKESEKVEDCLRTEAFKNANTDKYLTFDCEYTDLMQETDILKDSVQYWEMNSWTDESNRWQGWQRFVTRYKCFRLSNRVVTAEMVEQNLMAKTLAESGTVTSSGNYNLTVLQENQIRYGEYIFNDIARARKSWDGIKVGYLVGDDGELLNINYKEGLFNVYVFTRQEFIDDQGNYLSNPSRFNFTEQQKRAIDEIMASNNINVDRAVSCLPYTNHITGRWNLNDARGYYVIFEEIVTPTNTSEYGSSSTENNFDYSKNPNAANSYMTSGEVEFNLDDVTQEYSSEVAIKDLNDQPLTLTYPSYYFTNIVEGAGDKVYAHNIGYGANSPNYSTPTYNYFLQGGGNIAKEFVSDEHLETISDAVLRDDLECERIKITDSNNQTYTLLQLKNDPSQTLLYQSILSQLEEVYLLKVKESGSYRLCIYFYKNNQNNYEFDVWVSSPKGYMVTLYDRADFGGNDIDKDYDGLMTTRDCMTTNYSFIANVTYMNNSDLMFGNDKTLSTYVEFKIKENKPIPTAMIPYIVAKKGSNYIAVNIMLEYLDSQGYCLFNPVTGRYITHTNIQILPQTITGDLMLYIVDKPADIV